MAAITKVGSATFGITCTTPEAKIYEGGAVISRPEQQGLNSQSLVKI